MTTQPSEPGGDVPALRSRSPGWWMWVFLGFFLVLSASTLYFVAQPVPLARMLDPRRSTLTRVPGDAVRARIVVLGVARESLVKAVPQPPERAGAPMRIEVDWTTHAGEGLANLKEEVVLEVLLPAVDEVDVYDRRNGTSPERMRLTLAPASGAR